MAVQMTVNQVYFDESGNTGPALLDDAQPVFALSSLDYSDQEATELLSCVESSQGAEAKFVDLRKTDSGQRKLVRFFNNPNFNSDRGTRVKITVYHKPYMVISKAVDILLEPSARKYGLDLYERGLNISLANIFFICTPVFCGQDRFRHLLKLFVDMIRTKDRASIGKFFYWARRLHDLCDYEEHRSLLSLFLNAESSIGSILENVNPLSVNPAIPAFFYHCTAWGEQCGDFNAIHDKSKPLYDERDNLRLFMDKGIPPTEVGHDRRKFVLPLKATDLDFGDSRVFRQLQVADLFAGASKHLCTCRVRGVKDDLAQALEDAQLDSFVIGGVWPSEHVTPADLETDGERGINPIDFMAAMLSRKVSRD